MAKNHTQDGHFISVPVPSDIELALDKIASVFRDAIASGKHQPGDWRKQGEAGNWQHLEDHFFSVYAENEEWYVASDVDDHLANLCCRALLLLQLREEQR